MGGVGDSPELIARREEILARHQTAVDRDKARRKNVRLLDVLSDVLDEEDDELGCNVCHILARGRGARDGLDGRPSNVIGLR